MGYTMGLFSANQSGDVFEYSWCLEMASLSNHKARLISLQPFSPKGDFTKHSVTVRTFEHGKLRQNKPANMFYNGSPVFTHGFTMVHPWFSMIFPWFSKPRCDQTWPCHDDSDDRVTAGGCVTFQ